MSGFLPCRSCRRHVRANEPVCVFCGVDAPITSGDGGLRTMAILSAAALTLVACNDPPKAQAEPSASTMASAPAMPSMSAAPMASAMPEPSAAPVASASASAGADTAPVVSATASAKVKPTPTLAPTPTRIAAPRYGMAPNRNNTGNNNTGF